MPCRAHHRVSTDSRRERGCDHSLTTKKGEYPANFTIALQTNLMPFYLPVMHLITKVHTKVSIIVVLLALLQAAVV